MAILSSATACAPITAHNATGSVSNLVVAEGAVGAAAGSTATITTGAASPVAGPSANTIPNSLSEQSRPLQNLAERFHGLTERLGSLGGGHSRTESESSNRTRTGESQCPSVSGLGEQPQQTSSLLAQTEMVMNEIGFHLRKT